MDQQLPITDAERMVMEVVWKSHPISSRKIIDALRRQEDWHPKTIQTLISRLVAKEMLSHQQQGRRYLYSPTVERQAFLQGKSREFVRTFFKGRVAPLVAAFAQAESLSEDDLRELRQFVDSLDGGEGGQQS